MMAVSRGIEVVNRIEDVIEARSGRWLILTASQKEDSSSNTKDWMVAKPLPEAPRTPYTHS